MGNTPIKLTFYSYEGKLQSTCDITLDNKTISASITKSKEKLDNIIWKLDKYSSSIRFYGNKNAMSIRSNKPQKKTLSLSGPYEYNGNEYYIFMDAKTKLYGTIDKVVNVIVLEKNEDNFRITMVPESILVYKKLRFNSVIR